MRSSLKDFIPLFFLAFLLPSIAYSQIEKIYLNPKSVSNAKQSSFVDSIKFIPLEIRKEVKLVPYTSVIVTGKYFLLVDYTGKSVLIYQKDGRFIRKISYKKLGEAFYPAYHESNNELVFFANNKSYSLTPKDLIKIRLDWNNPRNKKYFTKYVVNLNDTTFTLGKQIPNDNDIVQAQPFYDNYYWQGRISTSPLYKEGQDFEVKIYKDKKMVNSFFPYNRKNEPRYLYEEQNVILNTTDKPFVNFVTRPFCDTIYKLTRDSMVPEYQLVMPLENSLPASFFTTPFKSKTDRENFQRNNGWMFSQVYTFYETPQLFYFVIGFQSNADLYIYQKKGNISYKMKNIKSDSSQYNLQLLGDFNLSRKNDTFYKVQKAGDLMEFFDQNKNVPVPKELVTFLKLKPTSTAPVIVEFKLKTTP